MGSVDRQQFLKALVCAPPEPGSKEAHHQRRMVLGALTGVSAAERITEENIGDLMIGAPIHDGLVEVKPANLDELIGRQPHGRGWGFNRGGRGSFWRGGFFRPYYGPPLLYAPPLMLPPPVLPVPVPVPAPVATAPPALPYGMPPEALLYDPTYDLPMGWMLLSNGYRVPLGADLSRLGGNVRVVRRHDRGHSGSHPGSSPKPHHNRNKSIKEPVSDRIESELETALATQNINDYPKYANQLEVKQRIEADMNATRAEFKRLSKMYAEKQRMRENQNGSV